MPPAHSTSDMSLRRDESFCRSMSELSFGGAPREALLRSIFRTGDLDKVMPMIGSRSTAGNLSSLDDVLSTGETLLHLAVANNRKDILLYLLEQGVFVDQPDDFSQTALQLAATGGNIDMVKILLGHGADPFMRRPSHFLPLTVVQGDCRILALLMSACGKKMRENERSGLTPEHNHLERKLSWSEPDLQKLVATTDKRGKDVAGTSQADLAKARSRTLPLGRRGLDLPKIQVTSADTDTIDGHLWRGSSPQSSRSSPQSIEMSPLSRATGERISIRMRMDTIVNKTIRRRHSDRAKQSPRNTLAMEPSWRDGMPPSLRFSAIVAH